MNEADELVHRYAKEFVERNWDKINLVKLEIPNMTKEQLIKDVAEDEQAAMWLIDEVMKWGMVDDFVKEDDIEVDAPFNVDERIIKIFDKYVKVYMLADCLYQLSIVTPVRMEVLRFVSRKEKK